MNEQEMKKPSTPNFKGEEMKMPQNAAVTEVTKPQSATNGPILVILAVLLLVVLGAMYYWFTLLNTAPVEIPEISRPTAEENNEPESTTAEAQTDTFEVVSTSDELTAIEADLESTNMDSLDAELQAIDTELDASAQ